MQILVAGRNRRYVTFSLLEVIIVLVILSTVFALVIPKVGHVASGLQRSSVLRTINSAFHMASSLASATGKPSKLIFDFNEGTMTVKRFGNSSDSSSSFDSVTEQSRESIFQDVEEFKLPEGTAPDPYQTDSLSESFEFNFFPNGEAAGSKLSLLVSGTQQLVIDVDRLTGKPLLLKYED